MQRQDDLVDQKTERLLDAAYEVFMATGFTKSTMADIAAAAGVSRPTLYRSFPSKDDIFLGVAQRVHAESRTAYRRAADQLAPLSERLTAVAEAKLASHIAIARSSHHAAELLGVNQRIGGQLAAAADIDFAEFVEAMFRSADGDEVDLAEHGVSPARAATIITTLVHGWRQRILDAGQSPPARWRSELKTAISAVTRGLA